MGKVEDKAERDRHELAKQVARERFGDVKDLERERPWRDQK